MKFELYLCEIIAVDLDRQQVSLKPLYEDIGVHPSTTLFSAPYAPVVAWNMVNEDDPTSGKVTMHPFDEVPLAGLPAGQFSYPQKGEMVLVAAVKNRSEAPSPLRVFSTSYEIINAIIVCRVFDKQLSRLPGISLHDNIWLDKSGAKIHLNHQWNDIDVRNVVKDAEVGTDDEGKTVTADIAAAQGHVTTVGNRRVDLIGDKWAGFGLLSHLFKPGKETSEAIIKKSWYPPDAEGNELSWTDLFSKDVSAAYEPNFAKSKTFAVGTDFWLDPPCPETGAYMRMHQSGQKLVISNVTNLEGQEVRFLRNRVSYIGSGVFPLSHDPEDDTGHGLAESTTEGSTVAGRDGHESTVWMGSSGKIATSIMKDGGLKTTLMGGIAIEVPETMPTTLGTDPTYVAEATKVKIKVKDVEIVIDGTADTVTITSATGFNITGDLAVTGSISATVDIDADGDMSCTNLAATSDVSGATGTF